MGSTFLGAGMVSLPHSMMMSNWQQDGESEETSFTSTSSISNFKSLNVGGDQVHIDALNYLQRLGSVRHPCPHHGKINITISPPFMDNIQYPYNYTHHIDNDQLPYYLLQHHEPSLPPPPHPPPFVCEDSYSEHFLEASEDHLKSLDQLFDDGLVTTLSGPSLPYLPCITCTPSPTPPPIISSTGSSPIASFANCATAIFDTPSMQADSIAPDQCQNRHLVSSSDMMTPSLLSIHSTISQVNKTLKGKKKRKRSRSRKNKEELESQRMMHIAVERNRRRQMNQHLNDLRSLMPTSYIQRGDQASIVGGAIRLVEELQKVLESLHLQKHLRVATSFEQVPISNINVDKCPSPSKNSYACSQSSMVNVQVEMVSFSSMVAKVIVPKQHQQLLHTLQALNSLSLKVLHLNITTFDNTIIYSFNLKVEEECQFKTPLELAKSIHRVFAA